MIALSLLRKRLQVSIDDQSTEILGACRRLASCLCAAEHDP